MKNDEYNIVNITNEKNNFKYEYTKAQNVEFSFQPENKNTLDDELNDNTTINDKVENNVLKSTKEKQKKQERNARQSVAMKRYWEIIPKASNNDSVTNN